VNHGSLRTASAGTRARCQLRAASLDIGAKGVNDVGIRGDLAHD
jgi:hypothetical protein